MNIPSWLAAVSNFVSSLLEKHHRHKTRFPHFRTMSSALKFTDIDPTRGQEKYGFHDYYYSRELDQAISSAIHEGKNLLVVGDPLAGKSRAVFQALKGLDLAIPIIICRFEDFHLYDYKAPGNVKDLERTVILVDDIHKYTTNETVAIMLTQYDLSGVTVVATCRSGKDLERLKSVESIYALFQETVMIGSITKEEARVVGNATAKMPPEGFDGTIGSIFLDLKAMRERYRDAVRDHKVKCILESIKRAYDAGLADRSEELLIARVEHICKAHAQLEMPRYERDSLLEILDKQALIDKVNGDSLRVEEVYLQRVYEGDFCNPEALEATASIFNDDFGALMAISARSIEKVEGSIGISSLADLGIQMLSRCLELRPLANFPVDHAAAMYGLGNAHFHLSTVTDKRTNCEKAISAYNGALSVFTLDQFPMEFSRIQGSLGNAYGILGQVVAKEENCNRAIAAFQEALKVLNLERFPVDYGAIQNNLGNAYKTLAEVSDTAINCDLAIASYQ